MLVRQRTRTTDTKKLKFGRASTKATLHRVSCWLHLHMIFMEIGQRTCYWLEIKELTQTRALCCQISTIFSLPLQPNKAFQSSSLLYALLSILISGENPISEGLIFSYATTATILSLHVSCMRTSPFRLINIVLNRKIVAEVKLGVCWHLGCKWLCDVDLCEN